MKNLLPLLLFIMAFFVTATAASADTLYTVKKNDCLWKIASHARTDAKTLYRLNRKTIGTNPNLLKIGQKLNLSSAPNSEKTGLKVSKIDLFDWRAFIRPELGTVAAANTLTADYSEINEKDCQSLLKPSSVVFAEEPYAIISRLPSASMAGNESKNLSDYGEQKSDKFIRKAAICSIIPVTTLTLYPLRRRIRWQRYNPEKPQEDGQPQDRIYVGSFLYNNSILFCSLGGSPDIFIAPLKDIARNACSTLGAETINNICFSFPINLQTSYDRKFGMKNGLCPLNYWQKRIFKKYLLKYCKTI